MNAIVVSDLHIGSRYFLFKEFEQFLNQKMEDVIRSNRQVDVIVAAELEKSTTKFPSDWHKFARDMRKRYKRMGIDNKVRIGFNPNWWSKFNPTSERELLEFRSFVKEMDFIAPSFYGDWSKMTNPCSTWKNVASRKKNYWRL